ncbi:MAG: succinylglutamate desuccinylase/aspartoacylase family protein [Candidatus Bathyarchaeia archaeon]
MTFKPFEVCSGEKAFGRIKVVKNLAAEVYMPVGVINGEKEGPTFTVTGGLYPTEYCGVEAASRLYRDLKPEELNGRLLVIPVVNMPVFQFRTAWMNLRSSISPMDGKNINNQFPGDPKGTITSRIANKLFEIIKRSDYHVDFRGGDLPESHLTHTIFLRINEGIDNNCEKMAKVFGLEYVLPGEPKIGHTSPGTLIYEAVNSGIPSIISESGLGYRVQPLEEMIMNHVNGTRNLLRYVEMIKGTPEKPEKQRFLDMEWFGVNTSTAGIFHAHVDHGDLIEENQTLGKITDLDGSTLEKLNSPIEGVVHTMYPRRLVFPGDRLLTLLKIGEPTGWSR